MKNPRPWVQAAIDAFDIENAIKQAHMAYDCGADLIEVGTPLIFSEGMQAISALKKIARERTLIVDFKLRENIYDIAVEAKKYGAEYITVTADKNDAGVLEALRARLDCGIKVVADLYALPFDQYEERAAQLEGMGVDAISLRYGYDEKKFNFDTRESHGVRGVKHAAPNTLLCTAAHVREDILWAFQQGADWVFFGEFYTDDTTPKKYSQLKEICDMVHSFRKV